MWIAASQSGLFVCPHFGTFKYYLNKRRVVVVMHASRNLNTVIRMPGLKEVILLNCVQFLWAFMAEFILHFSCIQKVVGLNPDRSAFGSCHTVSLGK